MSGPSRSIDPPAHRRIHPEAEGDIVNCESVPGQMGSLSVSSYSPHSMRAIHYVPLGPPMSPWGPPLGDENFLALLEQNLGRILRRQKPGPKNVRASEMSMLSPEAPGSLLTGAIA